MSSSSSLSSARRRRVGSQPVVNPHPTVSSSSQLSENAARRNLMQQEQINSSQSEQYNINDSNERPVMHPTQLLMQHDFRLFQMEKMVKSLSEKNGDHTLKSVNETSFSGDGINVDEIKVEVQKNILQSNELKNSVVDFAKTAIENDYDFDSFFENLQKLSEENRRLNDIIANNQTYMNNLNTTVLHLLTDFRSIQKELSHLKINKEQIDTNVSNVEAIINDETQLVKCCENEEKCCDVDANCCNENKECCEQGQEEDQTNDQENVEIEIVEEEGEETDKKSKKNNKRKKN
jgi:hypothetical protein